MAHVCLIQYYMVYHVNTSGCRPSHLLATVVVDCSWVDLQFDCDFLHEYLQKQLACRSVPEGMLSKCVQSTLAGMHIHGAACEGRSENLSGN